MTNIILQTLTDVHGKFILLCYVKCMFVVGE